MTYATFWRSLGTTLGLVGSLTVATVGCDPAAPTDYEGEVLASIKGDVNNASGSNLPDVDMALISYGRPGAHGAELPFGSIESLGEIQTVRVSGIFPASFRLDIHKPPPNSARMAVFKADAKSGEDFAYIWTAQAMAAIKGDSPTNPVKAADCLLSDPSTEFVIYVDRDVPADAPAPFSALHCSENPPPAQPGPAADAGHGPPCYSVPDVTAGQFFGGTLGKGYHLMKLRGLTTPPIDPEPEGDDDGPAYFIPRPTGFDEVPGGFETDLHVLINRTPGADCRPPKTYPYDGGVP